MTDTYSGRSQARRSPAYVRFLDWKLYAEEAGWITALKLEGYAPRHEPYHVSADLGESLRRRCLRGAPPWSFPPWNERMVQ